MRYNPHYHRHLSITHPLRHRRMRLASLIGILVIIAIFAILSRVHALNYNRFYYGFAVSLVRVVIAYFLSLLLALVLTLATTKSRLTENILLPILDVAQSFPSFALLPLLVALFGRNSVAVIIILVIAMIWPILFTMIGAIKTEREDLHDAAIVYGAHGYRYLRYYRLPMLLPTMITGSIVAWGEAWDVLVGAEIIAAVSGVGAYLGSLSGNSTKALALFLGISIYLLVIFILNQIIWLPLLHLSSRYQND